jgi:ATP-dependent Clp protease, protease subunit
VSSYLIPNVTEVTPRGERVADIYSRLLSERIVFLGTPLDDGVANVVVAQLLHLAAVAPHDIQMYINSPGGSFSSMMAIYDTMQFVAPDVETLCVGQATSTAAMLLAAGAPGKRRVLPHARIMLHQPHAELSRGSISDLALEAAELARVRAEAETLLARHTGRTSGQIRDDTDRALVLTAHAAVDYGIVDGVLAGATMVGSGGEQGGTTALRPDA